MSLLYNAAAVAIGSRAVVIEGPSGSGKSSLAIALIDRGAVLIGDDGVSLEARGGHLRASPPPRIAGLLEVRNLGLLTFPTATAVPVALALRLDPEAPRFIEAAETMLLDGVTLPLVRLWPADPLSAIKAELALGTYGIPV